LMHAGYSSALLTVPKLGPLGVRSAQPFASHHSRFSRHHACRPALRQHACPKKRPDKLRMSAAEGEEEEDPLRSAYAQEREAREKKLLPKQVDTEKLYEKERGVDYAEKDRNFRVRNGMLDPSADSDWAHEVCEDDDCNNEMGMASSPPFDLQIKQQALAMRDRCEMRCEMAKSKYLVWQGLMRIVRYQYLQY